MKYILILCLITIGCTSKDEAIEEAYNMIKHEEQFKGDCEQLGKCLGLYPEAMKEYNNDSDRKIVLKCRFYRSQKESSNFGMQQLYFDDQDGQLSKATIVCSMKGSHDETCKFPRKSKPKASPSPSKN